MFKKKKERLKAADPDRMSKLLILLSPFLFELGRKDVKKTIIVFRPPTCNNIHFFPQSFSFVLSFQILSSSLNVSLTQIVTIFRGSRIQSKFVWRSSADLNVGGVSIKVKWRNAKTGNFFFFFWKKKCPKTKDFHSTCSLLKWLFDTHERKHLILFRRKKNNVVLWTQFYFWVLKMLAFFKARLWKGKAMKSFLWHGNQKYASELKLTGPAPRSYWIEKRNHSFWSQKWNPSDKKLYVNIKLIFILNPS